ncbi:MAG: hypothetical protein F2520_02570 [Actinobacteria bacterium]|nr:hypothetical protein [Actinomycetota bacterium]
MKPVNWEIPLDPASSRILGSGLGALETAPAPMDWAVTDSIIMRHRLQGLLVHAVASQHLFSTADQRADVAHLELELTRNRVWHDMRLVEITAMLSDTGIDQRVLKGPAFGSLDYPDRIMRPTGDIDLLVRSEELPAAVATLCRFGGRIVDREPVVGYAQQIGKSTTVTMPDQLEVDLHRTLTRGPFGLRIRLDDLWSTSRSFSVGGHELHALGREESLLHACFHLMILSEQRALSVRDVAQFLAHPELDIERTIELATRWKARIVLASAVLLTTKMIPAVAHTPLLEWARVMRPSLLDRTYLRIAQPGSPIGPAEWPATFVELHSAKKRRMLVRSILRPIPGTNPPFRSRLAKVVRRSMGTPRPSSRISARDTRSTMSRPPSMETIEK